MSVICFAPYRFRVGRMACPKLVFSWGLRRNLPGGEWNERSFCYICKGVGADAGTCRRPDLSGYWERGELQFFVPGVEP